MDETRGRAQAVIEEAAARAAHEANRAWCIACGDFTQQPWDDTPEWARESARAGVIGVLAGNGPREAHDAWLAEKKASGWVHGSEKDPVHRTHPCMVPYDELPLAQQAKDHIYVAVVRAVLTAGGLMTTE